MGWGDNKGDARTIMGVYNAVVGVGKRSRLAETLCRVFGQSAGNDTIQACGQIGAPLGKRRDGSVEMLLGKFVGCVASKHGRAGQQVVEHSPKRVYIGIGTGWLTQELLWGVHLTPLAQPILLSILRIQSKQIYHPNICHCELPIEPDENTVHREVAVENSVLVSIFQHRGNLIQVATNSEDIQGSALGKAGPQ